MTPRAWLWLNLPVLMRAGIRLGLVRPLPAAVGRTFSCVVEEETERVSVVTDRDPDPWTGAMLSDGEWELSGDHLPEMDRRDPRTRVVTLVRPRPFAWAVDVGGDA